MSPQERESLLMFKQSPAMRPFREALAREAGETLASLMSIADETVLRQLQGKAKFLHDLLSSIDKVE